MKRAHRSRHGDENRSQAGQCEAKQETAYADLDAYVQRIVDAAPPLTPSQKDRLAALLNAGPTSTQHVGHSETDSVG